MRPHEESASTFCAAIRELASKPENLDNLELYLSMNFSEWLNLFKDPASIAADLREFARMEI